jgi:cytochrome c oxidase subunit 2
MRSSRLGLAVTAVIVVLLVGATLAVYAIDPGTQEAAPAAERPVAGQTVFLTKGCTGCHSRAGVSDGFIGPDLTNLAERAGDRVDGLTAEEYVRQSVLNPQAYIVSGYGGQMPVLPVDTAELDALVEYLLSDG